MIGDRIKALFPLPDGAAEQLDRHYALLTEWNARMNLTAVTDADDALHRHYADSLAALPRIPQDARVIDVGSGAGFPGVPLKLARPDITMTLLDALQKRVLFLREVIRTVPVDATAVHARAEDYARVHREAFDIAVSRAVASLPVLAEWLLPLVSVGGRCILYKGPGADAELDALLRVAPMLGGGSVTVQPVQIPGSGLCHRLVLVDKISPTPPAFPRKAGMAIKRPLG